MSRSSSASYHDRYPMPDIRIARSDTSDRSFETSSPSPYSGRGYEYREPTSVYATPQYGWHQPPPQPSFTRSPSGMGVPQDFQGYSQPYYASPPSRISPSTSSSRDSRIARDPQPQYPPAASRHYGSRTSSTAAGSRSPIDAPAQPFSPSQMQLVSYNNGVHGDSDSDNQHDYYQQENLAAVVNGSNAGDLRARAGDVRRVLAGNVLGRLWALGLLRGNTRERLRVLRSGVARGLIWATIGIAKTTTTT